jgi:peptidoglycan-associated lipoprotein
MTKSLRSLIVIALLLVGIMLIGNACGRKTTSVVPPVVTPGEAEVTKPPVSPAPTITLSASPAAITKGQTSTLTWSTSNATEVTIDGGLGTVEASGSRVLSPSLSTTYHARAAGPGGAADAEARITVSVEEILPVVPGTSVRLNDVEFFAASIKDAFFDYDSYSLREDGREALLESARALKERSHIRITIEGHCDERGSEAYNIALGDKRANAARDFLISQGIDPARIDTISYGEEKPFPTATGHEEESWRQNRRAHLLMR